MLVRTSVLMPRQLHNFVKGLCCGTLLGVMFLYSDVFAHPLGKSLVTAMQCVF